MKWTCLDTYDFNGYKSKGIATCKREIDEIRRVDGEDSNGNIKCQDNNNSTTATDIMTAQELALVAAIGQSI
eukprot:1037996-Ditylum_brightwellii.AAC.1